VGVKSREAWFDELWQFVRPALPPAPAAVVEIGCGRFGGLVPYLRDAGYDAVGVDPNAPSEPGYVCCEFEQYELPSPVKGIVACTALHHVADLDLALDRVAAALVPGGSVVVAEQARERFDLQTAQWCFDRLPVPGPDDEPGWLHFHRDAFAASGQPWEAYLDDWARQERLHSAARIVRGLDARFERVSCESGPYFFADLAGVSAADEQAAIDAGQIRACGVRYTATRR
jgi:hypothetical protein